MKIKMLQVWMAIASVTLAACSEDDSIVPENGSASIHFEMQTVVPSTAIVTRSFGPEITKDGFRIMAFRENEKGEFVYTQDVPTDQMALSGQTLAGQTILPVGQYKFVPTYESERTGAYAWPSLTTDETVLSDTLSFRQTKLDGSSVLFLETRSFQDLPVYGVGLTASTSDAVRSVLKRAVARVDLLFVWAKKNPDGSYTEIAKSPDVFGGRMPRDIRLEFGKLNRAVSMTAEQTVNNKGFTFFDENYSVSNMEKAVTIGTGSKTLVGTDEFIEYDNVRPADLLTGAAHVQGAYVFPFAMGGPFYTRLQIRLTRAINQVRTLDIEPLIPLERNKVTLVKIYLTVDDGGGGGGDIFDSNVTFQVAVNTNWDGYNRVNGEMQE